LGEVVPEWLEILTGIVEEVEGDRPFKLRIRIQTWSLLALEVEEAAVVFLMLEEEEEASLA